MEIVELRLKSIDIIKGIAIILVVFGHAVQGVVDSLHITVNSINCSILFAKLIIYSFHMPLFFFVSGIFADRWATKVLKSAFKDKLSRLVKPYFIWSFVTALFMQLASHYTNAGLGLRNFLLSPVVPFSIFWFIYVLFFIYIIYYLFLNYSNYGVGKKAFAIVCVLSYLLGPVLPDIWIVKLISRYAIFFSIGTWTLNYYKIENISSINNKMAAFTIILFSIITFIYIQEVINSNSLFVYYLYFVSALAGIGLVVALEHVIEKNLIIADLISKFGLDSMEIYCLHLIPLAGIRIFFLKIFGTNFIWYKIIIITVITMIICTFIIDILKRYNKLEAFLFGTKIRIK